VHSAVFCAGSAETSHSTVADKLKSVISAKRDKIDEEIEGLKSQLTPLAEAINALERTAAMY
jgi:gas vesicle protein